MQSMITYIHHTSKLLLPTLIRTSHSRWISPKTSSVGSSNRQQGHVFLFLNHGKMQIQLNKNSHKNSHTSLPSHISSLHITHSTLPPPPMLTPLFPSSHRHYYDHSNNPFHPQTSQHLVTTEW
ncbi:hypothetical protein ACB098_09G015800 [Castanea mollissima]